MEAGWGPPWLSTLFPTDRRDMFSSRPIVSTLGCGPCDDRQRTMRAGTRLSKPNRIMIRTNVVMFHREREEENHPSSQ
jgi:hypothetical protein